MIEPYAKDASFLADVRSGAAHSESAFRLWWLGQSGFLLQWNGRHVLLDPYLSESLTEKYRTTDKPHVRMTRRVVAPEKLDFVDVATSSHNHTDHLDGATLMPLMLVNPSMQLIIPEANRNFVAERLVCDPAWPVGLTDGATVTSAGFTFTAVPAAHESLSTDAAGNHHFLGYVVQFGRWKLYHSGDTMLYSSMEERLRRHNVDLALLPINGREESRRVAGNLDGPEAARLAEAIGARIVIPCHFDMFTFNTATPDAFAEEAQRIGQRYQILRNGEAFTQAMLEE